jgi:fructosamine-3-kinase
LTGGYTFQTWLLTLSDNQKVIFRHQVDLETGSGEILSILDILKREHFFYSNVNKAIGHICPEVYVVDGTRKLHENSYCIMEYIEGIPLNQCFEDLSEKDKKDTLYKIGEMAASINNLDIDCNHPFITSRKSWEAYIADKLMGRFVPHIRNGIITQSEADRIADNMRSKKASKTLSFLHLDMRHVNMIYNSGSIFLLDAENCEFGDPLYELAVIDCGGELYQTLIDGYMDTYIDKIDLESELYYYYKMERMALVLHVFMNVVQSDREATRIYLDEFNKLKQRLI